MLSFSDLQMTLFLQLPLHTYYRLFLPQKQYAIELLARAHMTNCNPSRTQLIQTPNWVLKICLYMHDPREPHLAALKRILRYIQRTLDFGFHLYSSTTISLVGYTYANWAGCPSTRRSTLVQHQRAEYIEIDIHFVRDLVTAGQVRVIHVPSRYQYADILTKGLPSALFEDFRSSLSIRLSPLELRRSINEDERLARAINGLCDGLTTAIEEKEKYILPPSQRRW
nr:ribonuclease H-like domain-containing protein [Tanacetum cinerariifolium]